MKGQHLAGLFLLVWSTLLLTSAHTEEAAELTYTNGVARDDKEASLCKEEWSFKCDDALTECIDPALKCNGVSECRNGRDESVEQCGCLPNEFQCNNTHCIDIIKRCDLNEDCEGGNDEENCETYPCLPTHLKCANHFCVPKDLACDFVDDCGDNSDEKDCAPRACYPTEFQCKNLECVGMTYICDGHKDCMDGSDEEAESCGQNFQCQNGLYILGKMRCDGWVDCLFSQVDELNCGRECDPNDEFRCTTGQCIARKAVCDGVCDCVNTCQDEDKCSSYGCGRGTGYLCRRTERCLKPSMVCDGHNDCKNTKAGMDEFFCLTGNMSSCDSFPPNMVGPDPVQCGNGQCVPLAARCDHWMDCLDGTDEDGCGFPLCSAGEFRCVNEQCIPVRQRCDGKADCIDRTDEQDCDKESCPSGTRRCDGGQCVTEAQWCDHVRDCPDGSDEKYCSPQDYPQCLPSQFRCANGQCVDADVVCYDGKAAGRRGCYDRSHLINCTKHVCGAGQFKCRRSYCVDEDQHCDGVANCLMTLSDEAGCPYICPHDDPMCMCEEERIYCENKNLTQLPKIKVEGDLEPFSMFYLTGNNLQLTNSTFAAFVRMTNLDLSNNSLTHIPDGCFSTLWRLKSLNLAYNQLNELRNGAFLGLSNLRTLHLQGNRIHTLYPDAFVGLTALTSLDLSHHELTKIRQNAFLGLRNLHLLNLSYNLIDTVENGAFNSLDNLLKLDLSLNLIVAVEKNAFHGMAKLETLYTDGFWFCCLARDVPECYPEPDEFSSCEDLMSNYVLRVSIWVLGMVASFGNLLVIGWRARDLRGGKVHSFLITNLAIGDFFMGVYLLIIAVVDSYYRGVYIIYDRTWRNSDLCRFSGFISTFSSELSVFTLTVITLDRLVCIVFPLRLKRLGLKQATIVMSSVWLVVFVLSVLPLLGIDYFREFYGRSGVCLALHVTPARPAGWEYSVAVFLVLNFVSFLVIFFSYLWMFIIAKRTRSAVRTNESKNDAAMARRMTLIVMTDFMCWVPIILLGFVSLGGARSSNTVYAWIAVFVLPLNSAINPVLYTISTAPFLGNVRKRASRFRKSFISSFTMDNTKHSYVDDRTTNSYYDRKSNYRHMDLIRMRSLNRSPIQSESDI